MLRVVGADKVALEQCGAKCERPVRREVVACYCRVHDIGKEGERSGERGGREGGDVEVQAEKRHDDGWCGRAGGRVMIGQGYGGASCSAPIHPGCSNLSSTLCKI